MTADTRETLAIRAALQLSNALARAKHEAERRDAAIMATLRACAPKLSTRGRHILYAFHADKVAAPC